MVNVLYLLATREPPKTGRIPNMEIPVLWSTPQSQLSPKIARFELKRLWVEKEANMLASRTDILVRTWAELLNTRRFVRKPSRVSRHHAAEESKHQMCTTMRKWTTAEIGRATVGFELLLEIYSRYRKTAMAVSSMVNGWTYVSNRRPRPRLRCDSNFCHGFQICACVHVVTV